MDVKEFLKKIADKTVESCRNVNLLPSPSIAQAIIESNKGNSELATKANALFGIKADKRWNGKTYDKKTKEYVNSQYVDVTATFRAYDSWDDSILDHANFLIVNSRYSNLVGVTDYKEYCKLIREDGYATSPTYTETLINCIETYNLTQYDTIVEVDQTQETPKTSQPMRSFNVHAGHNPSGKTACGSVGYLNESDENRNVCNGLIEKIKNAGHAVYNCTCDNGTSQSDVLKKIVEKCNQHTVDLDISIHFNAVSKEYVSDGKTKGVEVWIHPNNKGKEVEEYASKICKSIGSLGFTNRGVKYSDSLYVLKNTKAPAMLIECCFVDDMDDFALYNCDKMVQAIYNGLEIETVEAKEPDNFYYVTVGVYSSEENAKNFASMLAEKGYLMNEEGHLIKGITTSISKGKL